MNPELRQIIQAIDKLANRQTAHLEETRRQFERLDNRLEQGLATTQQGLAAVEKGLAETQQGLAAVEKRLAAVEKQSAETQERLAAVEKQSAETQEGLAAVEKQSAETRLSLAAVEKRSAEGQLSLAETRQSLASIERRLATATAEIRRAHVLIEDNRSAIELVAEGVAAANERIDSLKAEMNERFDSQESFFRSTIGHLATSHGGRLDQLERRVGLN